MRHKKRNDAFEKLQAHWYAKLKAEGFEDIENANDPKRALKSWHSFRFARRANHTQKSYDPDSLLAAQEYYRRACIYLEDVFRHTQLGLFEPGLEVRMLELHTQGLGVRKIGEQVGLHYLQVHKFIRAVKPKIQEVE